MKNKKTFVDCQAEDTMKFLDARRPGCQMKPRILKPDKTSDARQIPLYAI